MERERRTVPVRGGMFQADVREYGAADGEPLLFLHGSSSLVIDDYLDRLGGRFRVIAPTHPGFGESTGLEHIDDVGDLAIYYYDFMDAMGLASAHVVGHSLGGMLAAEFAAIDRSYTRKLVLCNAVGLWRDDAPVMDFFSEDVPTVMKAVWLDPESPAATKGRPDPGDPQKLADAMYTSIQSLSAAAKFLWPIPDKGLKKRIHRITAPTLVAWGAHDGLAPAVYAQEFALRIAGARIAMFEQSAHFPMIEQPDAWVEDVTSFLTA